MFETLLYVSVMSELTVLGFIGLPGAGKTTAASAVVDNRNDVQMLTMGDVARKEFDAVLENGIDAFSERMQEKIRQAQMTDMVVPSEDTSEELADFAEAVMDVSGEYFSTRAVDWVAEKETEKCIVDGIRSLEDVSGFTEAADEFQLVYFHTPFSVRLNRLQSRGRDSEATAEPSYLINRDMKELSWGMNEILQNEQPDMFYNNFDSEEEFTQQFHSYIESENLF